MTSELIATLTSWDAPSTSTVGAQRYSELAQAIRTASSFLYPRDISHSRSSAKPVETPDVTAAFKLVSSYGRNAELIQDFMDAVNSRFHLVRKDIQRFVSRLESLAALSKSPQTDQVVVEMLDRLTSWQRSWGMPLKVFNDARLIGTYTTFFHQLLHSSLPSSFPKYLQDFLATSLASLPDHLSDPPPQASHLQSVQVNYHKIPPPSPNLGRLGMLARYVTTLSAVAYQEIEKIAREEAEKGWDARRLTRARQRVGDGVANWLSGMFDGNETIQVGLRPMFSRFDYYLCKCFFDIRTDELFDIIVDYPDSMAALEDLKECLFKVDQRAVLVDKLKAANLKRLLHPGAETKDVITQYISTIRCLRILDPPGALLHKVAEPIRKHLRDRPDTIKCIVEALVEGDELQDENDAAGLISQSNDETVEDFSDPKWEPEPVDAAPQFRSGKASDIVSTLVSIYDSREVIVKELQVLLATRLLAVKDYDAVKEIRIIELLKIRFGEAALQVCDVMLKDMADSKRIDDHIQGDIKSDVHPLVISRMFWPDMRSSSLHLPPKLEAAQREYESAFHHFKPDKHLRWIQQLGTAVVTLELEDRVVEVEATPLQASIAELLSEKPEWTVRDLGERLSVGDFASLRNALAFWASEGVVKEEGGVWKLLEVAEDVIAPAFVEEETGIESVDQNRAESIREYWQFIQGLLSSLGSKTLEDIHHNLGTFADGYAHTMSELELFMQNAQSRGLVEATRDGKWRMAGER